jgi:hypothetical protein
MYCDNDIFFYHNPEKIIEIIGNKSVGIHTHRFGGNFREIDTGWYNVGVMYFDGNKISQEVALKWKDLSLYRWLPYGVTHGTCGDQKYLELFQPMFGEENICVFDSGTSITHLAPWCTDIEAGKTLMFFHFSHFGYDIKTSEWKDSYDGEWKPAEQPGIRQYYIDYAKMNAKSFNLINPCISLVGNLHINEENAERLQYLRCTLQSFLFIKDTCELVLNFEGCSSYMKAAITKIMMESGFEYQVFFIDGNTYGNMYTYLLEKSKYDYVLNFMEDHFCVEDNAAMFHQMLRDMYLNRIDIVKASFFDIERKCLAYVSHRQHLATGEWYPNTEINFQDYQQHYGQRFYIGVNFITTKSFALRFWAREFEGSNPHPWEISRFDERFMHNVMVPHKILLGAIDDDHGEPGTALINNIGQYNKFMQIFDSIVKTEKLIGANVQWRWVNDCWQGTITGVQRFTIEPNGNVATLYQDGEAAKGIDFPSVDKAKEFCEKELVKEFV